MAKSKALATYREKAVPSPEQVAALEAFAKSEGRAWKSALNDRWMTGNYRSWEWEWAGYLQQVRNQFGPSWLVKFQFAKEVK